ncbi:MAG TPA: DNA/RNA nuclease SfsA [Thermoanaerobacterales bacterium]|nr:DNA/RNA nuclease SfsA [Thermoanaerobacterales bacterium]
MIIQGKKVEAVFEKRLNRFVAMVNLEGKSIKAHVPNSGRLAELLNPGAMIVLRETENPLRKFRYDIIMAYKDNILVSVDSILPNKLITEVLKNNKNDPKEVIIGKNDKKIRAMFEYDFVRPEVKYKNSRFDIGLGMKNEMGEKDGIKYYLEVKGVTLVEKNIARFPDAPTERGTKHILELVEAKREGFGAGIFFVVQRQDAEAFSPNDAMDPAFGKALRQAAKAGVDIFAYRCVVEPDKIELQKPVEIRM